MKIKADVAILGNGIAANCLAIALAGTGIEAIVLGTSRPGRSFGEHLQPGGPVVAASFGLDFASLEGCRAAHGSLSQWGTGSPVATSYLSYPEGGGYNLDRRIFDKSLRSAADHVGSRRIGGFRFIDARHDEGRTILIGVVGKDAMRVAAKLAVDASGRSAALGRRLGARWVAHDRLLALAVVGLATQECDARLAVESAPNGWWYAVRLAEGRAMAAYLTDSDLLPMGRTARLAFWRVQLTHTRLIAPRLCQGPGENSLHQADSRTLWLDPQGAWGWIAIGDAAMAFDPISGSGIAKAMIDARETAEAIARQLAGDDRPMTRLLEQRKSRFEAYLAERAAIYRAAMLSEHGEFWSRRLKLTQPESDRR